MVPLTTEERTVGNSRHDRAALTQLDRELRKTDPDLHAWATQAQRLLPARRHTLAIGLLAVGAILMLLAGVARSWLIAFLAVAALCCGALLKHAPRVPTDRPNRALRTRLRTVAHRPAQALAMSLTGERPPADPVGDVAGTVVVAIGDGGPAADGALRYAADEARLRCVELVVLATYQIPIDPDLDDIDTPLSQLRAAAWARAAAAIGRNLPHPPARRIVVAAGSPARVLTRCCRDAGLIVVPSPRHRRLGALGLDSPAGGLSTNLRLPVVVVPPGYDP
jgi:nucleotide-binding universal stress UspA family protein